MALSADRLRVRAALLSTLLLPAFCAALAGQHLPRPLAVNVDHRGMPLGAAFDLMPSGAPRFAWNVYNNHQEKIFTAGFRDGRRSRTQQLTAGGGVYHSPLMLAAGEESGWAIWQQQRGLQWRIVARRLQDGFWGPIETLSEPGRDALTPAAVAGAAGLTTAWEDHGASPQRIVVRGPDGRRTPVSQADKPCYRPALVASADDELWALWDCYEGREYSVYARRIAPPTGEIVKLSGASDAMDVTARFGSRTGLVAAWVGQQDVIGKGALDQWRRVEVAAYRDGRWSPPQEVADLAHSLLSRLEPEVGAIWGFAGRRLHPMLVEDGGAVWLLWERKIAHDGRSTEPGELIGRRYDGERWNPPVKLAQGLVRYEVPSTGAARDGRLTLSGFDERHTLIAEEIDLAQTSPFEELKLTGWEPVELPLPHWTPRQRPSIEIGGVPHFLYWGDLHVHTTLTADAEGEVDELMHFARDKAKIDVVVMQENDAASWLNSNTQGAYRGQVLSDSEYALSVYFSRRYSEQGRFVALPGWEWSDRTDDNKANHRTVIFAADETPLLRHSEDDDFEQLCDIVEAAGGVMNSQHEVYRLVDRPCDANIEVAAGWGVYINQPEKIHSDLSAGFKVGFVATSDGHRRNPGTGGGLTGIWAPELTSSAILAALKNHTVFATNGSRIEIDARANGRFMGSEATAEGDVELSLNVKAPRPIVRAVLVRDGDEILIAPGSGQTLEQRHVDRPARGFHWYYWRVELEGDSPDYPGNIKVAEGHLGWSSPHRVTVR